MKSVRVFAVGEAIPLSKFQPGACTLGLKVTEITLKQSYGLSGSVRVVE